MRFDGQYERMKRRGPYKTRKKQGGNISENFFRKRFAMSLIYCAFNEALVQ